MSQTVYLLVHRHHLSLEPGATAPDFMEDGEPLFWDDSEDSFKLLGLYSSRLRAEERIGRARTLPGFSQAPDGFSVHEYTVDDARWPCGFRTGEDASDGGKGTDGVNGGPSGP
ncbi:hypothetical protein [Streptomyces microflavus]|uniref:hypothetical protein n=1 Tax=Streptomyces microflavus TaxID=1919 RepID=UPI00364C58BF